MSKRTQTNYIPAGLSDLKCRFFRTTSQTVKDVRQIFPLRAYRAGVSKQVSIFRDSTHMIPSGKQFFSIANTGFRPFSSSISIPAHTSPTPAKADSQVFREYRTLHFLIMRYREALYCLRNLALLPCTKIPSSQEHVP